MSKTAAHLEKMPGLVTWIESVLSTNKFKSKRQWAVAAGLTSQTLGRAISEQRITPETLIALADAAGADRVSAFIAAGWIRDEDIQKSRLSAQERTLISHVRKLPPAELQALIEASQSLLLRVLSLQPSALEN